MPTPALPRWPNTLKNACHSVDIGLQQGFPVWIGHRSPGGSFIDGRKQLTGGVAFNLLNEWIIDLSYTDYSGGGRYNLLRSRDFFGASVSYAF